jgi:hypothetical protein
VIRIIARREVELETRYAVLAGEGPGDGVEGYADMMVNQVAWGEDDSQGIGFEGLGCENYVPGGSFAKYGESFAKYGETTMLAAAAGYGGGCYYIRYLRPAAGAGMPGVGIGQAAGFGSSCEGEVLE